MGLRPRNKDILRIKPRSDEQLWNDIEAALSQTDVIELRQKLQKIMHT
jgi:hypothetical protein